MRICQVFIDFLYEFLPILLLLFQQLIVFDLVLVYAFYQIELMSFSIWGNQIKALQLIRQTNNNLFVNVLTVLIIWEWCNIIITKLRKITLLLLLWIIVGRKMEILEVACWLELKFLVFVKTLHGKALIKTNSN